MAAAAVAAAALGGCLLGVSWYLRAVWCSGVYRAEQQASGRYVGGHAYLEQQQQQQQEEEESVLIHLLS